MGGIDFRSLPIVTRAMSNLNAGIDSSMVERLRGMHLDQEWEMIRRLTDSEIKPSADRIKEYVLASCLQSKLINDADKVIICISDILRKEEEDCELTESALRDILVLLQSGMSGAEVKSIFTGKL